MVLFFPLFHARPSGRHGQGALPPIIDWMRWVCQCHMPSLQARRIFLVKCVALERQMRQNRPCRLSGGGW